MHHEFTAIFHFQGHCSKLSSTKAYIPHPSNRSVVGQLHSDTEMIEWRT
jgi:hypothetical protein